MRENLREDSNFCICLPRLAFRCLIDKEEEADKFLEFFFLLQTSPCRKTVSALLSLSSSTECFALARTFDLEFLIVILLPPPPPPPLLLILLLLLLLVLLLL